MTMRTHYTAGAALLALALGAGPALAQTTPETTPATPPAASQPAPATTPTTPEARKMDKRVEEHITELHRRLHITAAEQPQWEAFAQVMRENAMHMDQEFAARAQTADMNAVDDMRSYAAVAQAHAEDMQRLLPAFQTLYSALSPQQQHTADEVFREFEHRPGRHKSG